jgi:hypothetical protein
VKLEVTGERPVDAINVTSGQQSTVIDVTAGTVTSVNGRTGAVTISSSDVGAPDWINVVQRGAVGDGIADDTAALQAAIDACQPGGTVYLPRGVYKTTATLDLKNGVTLRGSHANLMVGPGMGDADYPCYIQAAGPFTGTSVIQIIGDADGIHPAISGEQRILNLMIDGSQLGGSSVDGLFARGNVQNVVLDNVTIRQMPNNGIVTASRGDGTFPYSWRLHHVMVDNCHANGILFTGNTDITLDDVQVIGCWAQGFVLTNCTNAQLIACRAEWMGSHGYHLTGAWGDWAGSGGMQMTGCSTDRNGQHGVLVDATGNTPILISSLQTRRDGRNGGAGGGGYAGLAVIGATVPVTIDGINCYPGVDDGGASINSPQYGARLSGSSTVTLDNALLHADTAGLLDDGTNTLISLGSNIVTAAGATTSTARTLRPRILDWVNVKQRGAKGDGTTDDTAVIQAALTAAQPGDTIYLPAGTYRTSAPLTVPPGVTLRGSHGDHFDNLTGWTQVNARIKPLATFSGVACILILDAPLGGYAAKSCEQRLLDLTLDGTALPGGNTVDGIQAQGTIRGMIYENLSIKKFGGHAIYFTYNFSAPPGLPQAPYSNRLRRIVASDCGGNTYSFNNMTDSTLMDVESIGSAGYGFFLSGCGNSTLIACRAEWNLRGFHIVPGNAQLSLIGCSTDRNTQNGMLITGGSAGATVAITNARLNRDGRNGNSGGGGYAGLTVDTCPAMVVATDINVLTGVDDDGSGTRSPQYGVNVLGSAYVAVTSGILNAATTGFRDGGTNTTLLRGPNVGELVGNPASPSSTTSYGLRSTPTAAQFIDSSAVAHNLIRPSAPLPVDHGFLAWAYDPSPAGTFTVFTGGVIQLVRIPIRATRTITNICLYIGTAGNTLTAGASWAGLYDSTGARLGQTADQAAAWISTGLKTMAIAGGPVTLNEGYYWVACVSTGTTIPALLRASGVGGGPINVGLSASNTRFGTFGTSQTTLPTTITPGSIGQANNAYWAALS